MVKCDYPLPGEETGLAKLWKQAFGDSDELIGSFFRLGCDPRRCRRIIRDGNIAAALYWFDVTEADRKYAYLYAVATRQDCRGQGLCRTLMADTHAILADAGYDGCLLVPGAPELFGMYKKLGYQVCTTVDEFTVRAEKAIPLRRLDTDEYAALRRTMLPPDSAVQEGSQLVYLGSYSQFLAGDGWLACGMVEGSTFHCAELLGNRAAAPGITAALGCAEGRFRTPGDGREFAMFFPLTDPAAAPKYFGLALD